jgi:hypothetical protein
MITASIIADSINPMRKRLTTFVVTYPRFIHSEFMTHRAFSRNAASSRAIPAQKMVEAVIRNPAIFEQVGAANKGMQAEQLCDKRDAEIFIEYWRLFGCDAAEFVMNWSPKIAKQVINRVLEPWSHITVVATASDWGLANFFNLRAHPMAQPEFQVLAYRMLNEYMKSLPLEKDWNEWHIPFYNDGRFEAGSLGDAVKASVGRCAGVSYLREDRDDPVANIDLHNRLVNTKPMHASAFEHTAQAQKLSHGIFSNFDRGDHWSGWLQYRKSFPTECSLELDAEALMAAKPEWVSL